MLVQLHRATEQLPADMFFMSTSEALGIISLREIHLNSLYLPVFTQDKCRVSHWNYESAVLIQSMHKFTLQDVYNLSDEGAKLTIKRAKAVDSLNKHFEAIVTWAEDDSSESCFVVEKE